MSFCVEIKNELAELKTKGCCKTSLIYGFALFGRSFSAKRICLQTENEKTAKSYASLLSSVYGVDVDIRCGGGKCPTYIAEVGSEFDRLKILASVDFGIYDKSIYNDIFYRECCKQSFIRGAFLACGHLSDPNKSYRVDFYIKNEALAKEFSLFLAEHLIESHISKCGNGFRVYIKKNEMIVNLFAVMGASAVSLKYIETSVIKSFNNKSNRAINCDNANINRTVMASKKQRDAIEFLIKNERLESLPEELKKVAKLRMENPELSLKQLAGISPDSLTVSGLNHRLKRIMEIYEEVKKIKE
ncbi:MAG: DNA-binding protein WhiA [Clostridia bacterium]|nr:DNA-binding protein WhiA [Clostridia bacterium]